MFGWDLSDLGKIVCLISLINCSFVTIYHLTQKLITDWERFNTELYLNVKFILLRIEQKCRPLKDRSPKQCSKQSHESEAWGIFKMIWCLIKAPMPNKVKLIKTEVYRGKINFGWQSYSPLLTSDKIFLHTNFSSRIIRYNPN